MSKKIRVTVEIEVEDDDYEGEIQKAVENDDFDYFSDWLFDLYSDSDEDLLKVVTVAV